MEQFLAEMEKTKTVNVEMTDRLIQEKYEAYSKAEKWKEVMKDENLTRVELMALGRVGCGLGDEEFSGAGGFMELVEVCGFDRVAEADQELYARMFGNLMALDWRDIYSREKMSRLEIAVMAQNVLNFEKTEDWDDFATMSLKTDLMGNYYLDYVLEEIKEVGLSYFEIAQYSLLQVSFNEYDMPEKDLERLNTNLKKWGENLVILNFLTSDAVSQSHLRIGCADNGEKIEKENIFKLYKDKNDLYLEMMSHQKKTFLPNNIAEKINCVLYETSEYSFLRKDHMVIRILLKTGDAEKLNTVTSNRTARIAMNIKKK